MVTTRKGSRLNAGKDNTETRRTPAANDGPSHAEDEVPVAPPPPQPSLRGEPSGSLARHAHPTRSTTLQMVQDLLGHPPAPEGHAAWIARIRELTDIAGDLPPPS